MRVDIGIATFKRPELLCATLCSLVAQETTSPGLVFRIVVVDNDSEETGREVVESVLGHAAIPFVYAVEPEQNIALARNRILDLAGGECIALIDDDEIADRLWLQHLLDCARRQRADVVFGPVIPAYPEGTPDWVIAGRFFDPPRHATGTEVLMSGAGNVLLARSTVRHLRVRFDPGFGRTGGEDTELFSRLHRAGAKLVWCDEAVVHEPVALERANLGYLVTRSFRYGRITARVRWSVLSPVQRLAWFVSRIVFLAGGTILGLAMFPFRKSAAVWVLCKAVRSAGHLSILAPRLELLPELVLRPEQQGTLAETTPTRQAPGAHSHSA
jgi:succinoglycan biosynthesis protein ExoM